MDNQYKGVSMRFLRENERFALSEEKEMPLVIEPKGDNSLEFLQQFLSTHSEKIIKNLSHYGAVLLRGFAINSDEDFEKVILSIP
ncbi:MAG: hypothetical protein PSV35_05520, partial [bacterium]|nr:hypothetical protein [bacterium]